MSFKLIPFNRIKPKGVCVSSIQSQSGRSLFHDDEKTLLKAGVKLEVVDAILRLLEEKLNGRELHSKQWRQLKDGDGLCEIKYHNPLLRLYYYIDTDTKCCVIMSFVQKSNNRDQTLEINRLKKFRTDYL
jgi:hypothetical protein